MTPYPEHRTGPERETALDAIVTRVVRHLQAYGLDAGHTEQAIRRLGSGTVLAYNAALYEFEGPQGRVQLQPGKHSPELDALLQGWQQDNWCFITACNPCSQLLDAAQNGERQSALRALLALDYRHLFDGAGRSASNDWREASVLVAGMDFSHAVALGRVLRQHAVLIGRRSGPAELLFIGS
ncbi:MAG TPA: hypothetical protein DCP75_03165 [Haliea salexigens]|uniref:DUF3293 domain-containing protein n=1 Tax=Haliea salexigens TaxID=287487 RepID=A0A3C1KJ22_9GAMM|nr:hypothetical protein [Haliea salexigens]|tara:strand:- start:9531 stop:10076 length:546 start_codon:yes stop_codon:yes gene_type:complete